MGRYTPHTDSPTEIRRAIQRLNVDFEALESATGELEAEADEAILDGQPLYRLSGLTKLGVARADAASKSRVAGLAVNAQSAGKTVTYMVEGQLTLSDWSDAIGSADLTSSSIYYLALTGGLTDTAPTGVGEYVVEVGQAISTATLDITIKRPILL